MPPASSGGGLAAAPEATVTAPSGPGPDLTGVRPFTPNPGGLGTQPLPAGINPNEVSAITSWRLPQLCYLRTRQVLLVCLFVLSCLVLLFLAQQTVLALCHPSWRHHGAAPALETRAHRTIMPLPEAAGEPLKLADGSLVYPGGRIVGCRHDCLSLFGS